MVNASAVRGERPEGDANAPVRVSEDSFELDEAELESILSPEFDELEGQPSGLSGLDLADESYLELPNEGESLRNQPNFAVFRGRYIERLKGQLRELDKTLKHQAIETDAIQKEEETNADWMWNMQSNYAKLEKEMAGIAARRLELKNEMMDLEDDFATAQKHLRKEEKYQRELEQTETKSQQEVQKLNEYYQKYYEEKEQTYMDAKIVDSGITRQRKELALAKLQKRNLDFEIYRFQRTIITAEERMELRDAIKRQRQEELQDLKAQKLELEAELEMLNHQSNQVSRSLTNDMRILEEKNNTSTVLTEEVKQSYNSFRSVLAETNGYKKDIRALQSEHEHLTLVTIRCTRDLVAHEKRIEVLQQNIEALYGRHGQLSRLAVALKEKGDALAKYQEQRERELQDIRDQLTQEIQKKVDTEMEFHEALMENKSFLKAAKHALAEYGRLSEKLSQLEQDIGQQEHQIAQQAIYRIEATNEMQAKNTELEKLAVEVKQRENKLKETMTALDHESAAIDRRQDKINRLTAKLDSLIAAAGGEEISPVELQLANIQSDLQASEDELRKLKNDWLRYQTSIVRLTENRDQLHAKATDFDNQAFIATYKLNRLNKEIAQIESECEEYSKSDKKIQENIARASQELFKFNKQEQEIVMKALDAEHAAIENLRKEEVLLEDEKANLAQTLQELKEVEKLIYETKEKTLMWERKLELKKQAKKSIEEDFNEDELEALRNEVHKLQLDKQALEKEQLKVTQEMLFSAERRDQLHTQARRRVLEGEGPSLKKMEQAIERKGKDLQFLQKELKNVQILEEDCRRRLDAVQKTVENQTDIVNNLEETWKTVAEEKTAVLKERFQVRINNFVAQLYGKNFLSVKSGKYIVKKLRPQESSGSSQVTTDLKQKTEALEKVISAIGQRYPGIYDDKKNQMGSNSRIQGFA